MQDAERDSYRDGHFFRHAEEEIKLLYAKLEESEKTIAQLRAENTTLHRKQFKANRKIAIAVPQAEGKKKRGPPAGHPPWTRKPPDHVDQTVHVPPPETCPHCGTAHLKPLENKHTSCQEDIIIQPKTFVTEYIHDTAFCPKCRRAVFQNAQKELRNSSIGPVAKATAVFMRHEVKLSYRDIRKIFSGIFGLPFVPASAMNFDRKIAALGRPIHEDLRLKVRALPTAHADETHWRIDGKSAQLWYAGNQDVAFYLTDPSRGGDVAVSIFGKNWPGNLVADAYAGYNPVNPKRRQSCLSHLSNKAKEIIQEIQVLPANLKDKDSLAFCSDARGFLADCCALGQARNTGAISFFAAKARKPRLQRRLIDICKKKLGFDKAENLRQRLIDPDRDANRIFTFLDVNGMQPTNNHAEQSLRLPVIFRKICFGNRSMLGANTLSANLSMLTTAKRQHRNPIAFFQTLLLKGPTAAQPLLFKSPSGNSS